MATIEEIKKLTVTTQWFGDESGPGKGLGFVVARFKELGHRVRGTGWTEAEAIEELEDLTLDAYENEELPVAKAG